MCVSWNNHYELFASYIGLNNNYVVVVAAAAVTFLLFYSFSYVFVGDSEESSVIIIIIIIIFHISRCDGNPSQIAMLLDAMCWIRNFLFSSIFKYGCFLFINTLIKFWHFPTYKFCSFWCLPLTLKIASRRRRQLTKIKTNFPWPIICQWTTNLWKITSEINLDLPSSY